MQKLEERNTYTPTNIPHVRGNCDPVLNRTETSVHAVSTYGAAIRVCEVNRRNGLEETLSVLDLKTSSNNSDAALTGFENSRAEPDGICCKNSPLLTQENDSRFVNPVYINARGQIPPVAKANGFPLTP